MRVAVITASTPIYRGQEEDASGKVIRHILEEAGHDIVFQKALPCDKTVLSTVMQRMVDGELADLILTQEEQDAQPVIVCRKLPWRLWTDRYRVFRRLCVHIHLR